jgi:hypothetical protein
MFVTGGGFVTFPEDVKFGIQVFASFPESNGWTVWMDNSIGIGFKAYAACKGSTTTGGTLARTTSTSP